MFSIIIIIAFLFVVITFEEKNMCINKLINEKVFVFAVIVLIAGSCKKQSFSKLGNDNKMSRIDQGLPPSSRPAITSPIELYAQLQHIAVGMAGVVQNATINRFGSDNLIEMLTSNIPANENELPIANYHNLILDVPSGTTDRFSLSTSSLSPPNSSDLYDALTIGKANFTQNTSISPAWLTDFYTYFDMGAQNLFTLIRIPELKDQGLHPDQPTTPVIFIADNILGKEDYDGYVWDFNSNSVKTISLLNDDIIEEHIDNKTAYIVVIAFDELLDGVAGGRSTSSCEGGTSCIDEYCDQKCGESEDCLDCQPQTNKSLYLYEIQILNDERVSRGGVKSVIDKHFVSVLGGKYKLALNSVVLHANGKWDAINNESIRPKWNQDQVHRVKVKNNGKRRSKGTNTWKTVWLKGDEVAEKNKTGILLAENFNPNKAIIYLSVAENDVFGKKRDIFPPTFRNIGISNDQVWKSLKMPTLCGPAKANFFKDDATNPTTYQTTDAMIEIRPISWVDPTNPKVIRKDIEVRGLNVAFKLRYE